MERFIKRMAVINLYNSCFSSLNTAADSSLRSEWHLMVFPTTGTDPSRPLMMTINVSFIMTCFPKIVIQNGGKNALWEGRETGQWHRVKNLLRWWRLTAFLTTGIDPSLPLWMTPYGFPPHGYKSFAFIQDNALYSSFHSERGQECFVKTMGNGIMTQSEESMTRMTPYRFSPLRS